uniref:Putative ovule protein n=1 Tax=Solanum chacoense TaxID=4108 RepID=A0A0V0GV48_SOLCH
MYKKDRRRCIRTRSLANIQKKLVKLAMVMRNCLQNQVTQTRTRRDSLVFQLIGHSKLTMCLLGAHHWFELYRRQKDKVEKGRGSSPLFTELRIMHLDLS